MIVHPVRLQMRRVAGFDLQAHSREVNGLPAKLCARPGPWANPLTVDAHRSTSEAVDGFRLLWATAHPSLYRRALAALPGHNLACYCDLWEPCHVDVLLDLFGRLPPLPSGDPRKVMEREIEGARLVLTCSSFPEQYDVFVEGEFIGYLHIRWGEFTANIIEGDESHVVYSSSEPMGFGDFEDRERVSFLTHGVRALLRYREWKASQ